MQVELLGLILSICAYISVVITGLLIVFKNKRIDPIYYRQMRLILSKSVFLLFWGIVELTLMPIFNIPQSWWLYGIIYICIFGYIGMYILQLFNYRLLLITRCMLISKERSSIIQYNLPSRMFNGYNKSKENVNSSVTISTPNDNSQFLQINNDGRVKSSSSAFSFQNSKPEVEEFDQHNWTKVVLFSSGFGLLGALILGFFFLIYRCEMDQQCINETKLINTVYAMYLLVNILLLSWFVSYWRCNDAISTCIEVNFQGATSVCIITLFLMTGNYVFKLLLILNIHLWNFVFPIFLYLQHYKAMKGFVNQYSSFLRCWNLKQYRPALGKIARRQYCFELFSFMEEYEALTSDGLLSSSSVSFIFEKYIKKGSLCELNVSESSRLTFEKLEGEKLKIGFMIDEVMTMLYDNVFTVFLTQNK